MMEQTLNFNVRSGGNVSIDLKRCKQCESKACTKVCQSQMGPLVLDEKRGIPSLRWSLAEVERGGCVECLGCELDCTLYGQHSLIITLPLSRFDDYIASLDKIAIYEA